MNTFSNIWAFDLGTSSIGEAVLKNDRFLHIKSNLIDEKFAAINEASERRRQMRTRQAHKARESWLDSELEKLGIEVLKRKITQKQAGEWKIVQLADKRLEQEFSDSSSSICYNSIALRAKLILGEKLESWQVYKALNSAIQLRGYDANVVWKSGIGDDSAKSNSKDDSKEEFEKLSEFKKEFSNLIQDENYAYPCFFKAYKMGLWNPENPREVAIRIDHNAGRASGYTVPREDVEKEFVKLVEMASLQYPELTNKAMYLLYGPAESAYASFYPAKRKEFNLKRGAISDWNGALGQKIPRFDNRIIEKCCLMPRFNVCKIKALPSKNKEPLGENDLLHYELVLAMNLLNMRFERMDFNSSQSLDYEEFIYAMQVGRVNRYKFTKTQWKKFLDKINALPLPNQLEVQEPRMSGRASFCRLAMCMLLKLIMSGENPSDFYAKEIACINNTDPKKGILKSDLDFIKRMGDIPWAKIYLPNLKTHIAEDISSLSQAERRLHILELIGRQKDPIVRHRLNLFYERLMALESLYSKPDIVVLEFIRDDFLGDKAKKALIEAQNLRRKKRKECAKELDESGIKGGRALLKYELLKNQNGYCVYTGEALIPSNIAEYEIEHIVPRTQGGPDSIYNYVICKKSTNLEKGELTPYEWLKNTDKWNAYLQRVEGMYNTLGKKRVALLTSSNAKELVEKYTTLAETAWIAKLAQTIVCLNFGFSLSGQKGERQVRVVHGAQTAVIRNKFNLTELLAENIEQKADSTYTDFLDINEKLEKKNRANKKHHALDAMVLAISPLIKQRKGDITLPEFIGTNPKEFFRQHLATVVPTRICQAKPKLEQTIYGKANVEGKEAIVLKKELKELAYKAVGINKKAYSLESLIKATKKVLSPQIRAILEKFSEQYPNEEDWLEFVKDLRLPAKNGKFGARIVKVRSYVGSTEEYAELSKDGSGMYVKGSSNKAALVWRNKKGKYNMLAVYAHQSFKKVIDSLKLRDDFDDTFKPQSYRVGMNLNILNDVYDAKGENVFWQKGICNLKTAIPSNNAIVLLSIDGSQERKIMINNLMKAGIEKV
ncbi:MAG: HNH endonuclease domain-containing protein [Opitutales bacterium]